MPAIALISLQAFVKQFVHQPNGRERPAQVGGSASNSGQQPQLGVDDVEIPHSRGLPALLRQCNSRCRGAGPGAKTLYAYWSCLVHGCQWLATTDTVSTPFGIIADGLAAAVNMTECAVVLFEAVSRDPSGHGSQRGSHAENRPATAHSLRLLDLLAGVHD